MRDKSIYIGNYLHSKRRLLKEHGKTIQNVRCTAQVTMTNFITVESGRLIGRLPVVPLEPPAREAKADGPNMPKWTSQ